MESFPVTRIAESRKGQIDYNNLRFGVYFTDHIFVMDYSEGRWHSPRIEPNGPMAISPANMTFHYGQAVFEGQKAFRRRDGSIVLFRPDAHVARLNRSCRALCIPDVPEDTVLQGIRQVVELEREFVPSTRGHSLYIRPFVIAMDNLLGVQSSQSFRLIVLLSPVANYYPEGLKPVRLHVAQHHSRAARGGLGMAKTPANYAASAEESASAAEEMTAQAEALKEAVSELLRLVDGQKSNQGYAPRAIAARPIHHLTTSGATRTTKITTHGNGGAASPARSAKPAAPALAHAGGRKNGGIPMEGDFKDF